MDYNSNSLKNTVDTGIDIQKRLANVRFFFSRTFLNWIRFKVCACVLKTLKKWNQITKKKNWEHDAALKIKKTVCCVCVETLCDFISDELWVLNMKRKIGNSSSHLVACVFQTSNSSWSENSIFSWISWEI